MTDSVVLPSNRWNRRLFKTEVSVPSMEEPSDGKLVRDVLDGDEGAVEALVHRYTDVLYRYAERMLGRPDDAADVVQRTFVNGYYALARCKDPDRVGGWLFRITINLCKDQLKRPSREVSLDSARPVPTTRGLPEERADRAHAREEIQRALNELSATQKEAFVLKHVVGLSYQEMEELLQVSESALKMRVLRARERLRALLVSYK